MGVKGKVLAGVILIIVGVLIPVLDWLIEIEGFRLALLGLIIGFGFICWGVSFLLDARDNCRQKKHKN